MKSSISVFCLLLTAFLWFSCSEKQPERPNILLLIAEDISPVLGCYGDDFSTTPALDKLGREGIVYTKALTTAPICAPSRSALATGVYATTLGTQHLRSDVPFPDTLLSLPELMRNAGYFTALRGKTDYNFNPEGRWDLWDETYTPWRKNNTGKPFYSYMNIGPSHEGSVSNRQNVQRLTSGLADSLRHDPDKVTVPPYYPDSPEIRRILADYFDVITVLDQNVGYVLDSLEMDGLMDQTIVIFIADHGLGLPRYKRWLYKTGLNVPMIVGAPEKYRHLIPGYSTGSKNDQLVSFIDLPPTILNLAGAKIPTYLQGKPLYGRDIPAAREYAFGARDRADDMVEMSRSVTDGRYFYVRNYMPHYAYIQPGYIFSDEKDIFRELRRLYLSGECNEEQLKLWHTKPVEELYDWESDPFETNNLAGDPAYAEIQNRLKSRLHNWMVETRDLGLLPEAEYMIQSTGSSPYEYGLNADAFNVAEVMRAAEMVGKADEASILKNLNHTQTGVRYWGVIGLMQFEKVSPQAIDALAALLSDPSPSVQIAAAETLCKFRKDTQAVDVLGKWALDDRPWVALQASRSIQLIGEQARPLIPVMYEVLEKNLGGPGSSHRKYKDFNYSAFTSWALEWALKELGEDVKIN